MAAIYMMKHYEFTYLTRQDMPEDEAKKLQDKLVALIAAKNGTITDLPKAYKKRLAYRVKKQDAAYVNTILFQTEPAFAVGFKKDTDTIAEILRGLVIWYDPEKLKREPRRERPAAKPPVETEMAPAQSFPAVEEKTAKTVAAETPKEEVKKEKKEEAAKMSGKETETKPASAQGSELPSETPAKDDEAKPAKPKRKTKVKAELRDIEEKLDEILK